MKTNPREILLFYNSESSSDRQTVAHAMSVTRHIKAYDHAKGIRSTTSWQSILNKLALHPKMLLNKAHPDYQKNIRGKEFDDEGWIYVLRNNPHLIKWPIAIKGHHVMLISTPTDIYRI